MTKQSNFRDGVVALLIVVMFLIIAKAVVVQGSALMLPQPREAPVETAGMASLEASYGWMPPYPGLIERLIREGKPLPPFITNPDFFRAKGINQGAGMPAGPASEEMASRFSAEDKWQEAEGPFAVLPGEASPYPVSQPRLQPSGNFNALALLVDFSDNPSSVAANFFDQLIYGASGNSVRVYYEEVSYGTLTLVTLNLPGSTGWYTAPNTYAYYTNGNYGFGPYPQNAQRLTEDVVYLADPYVDFSQYDNNSDGYVDALFIIHAGPGAEFTGNPNDIWSHKWSTANPPLVDGVYVTNYSTEPEYWSIPGDMTIGVYAHELGHVFGLPDLYDYGGDSAGIGRWSLMASGSWNGPLGSSPAYLDAWSRVQLGFVTPVTVTTSTTAIINSAEMTSTNSVYYVWNNGAPNNEYFLVENRQQVGYDAYLPGSGLLIWHVDENMSSNSEQCTDHQNSNCPLHFKVALEQADGNLDLEWGNNSGDAGDPYPGTSNNRTFDLNSIPNSGSYANSFSTVRISNISDSGITMTAEIAVVADYGVLLMPSEQEGYGNAGEVVTYTEQVVNYGANTDSYTLTLSGNAWSTTLWDASFTTPISNTGVIVPGDSITIGVQVAIPAGAGSGDMDTVVLQATSVASPTITDTAKLTTAVLCSPSLTFSGQSPQTTGDLDDIYNYVGQKFTYVYIYANSSDNDTLDVTVSGYDPNSGMWQTIAQQFSGGSGVIIDQSFIPPTYTQVRVEMDDWENNDLIYYDYQFIVCREPAVALDPPTQTGFVPSGSTITYTQTLVNYMMSADSFDLQATANTWPTTFWDGATQITNTGVLADLQPFTFTVKVEVPANANEGDVDVATIQATSLISPSISATATLTTTVLCSPSLTFSGQSPQTTGDLDDIYNYGGQKFTYVYIYANSSDNDTLDVTVSGYDPNSGMWQTIAQQFNGSSGVIIDQSFIPPTYTQVRVEVDDGEDNDLIYYDYQFIVCREPTVALDPPTQTGFASSGSTITYTQTLVNYMMIADSFDLQAIANTWPTTFWNGATQITNTGVLADLQPFTFTVKVEVPSGIQGGNSDIANIQATSVVNPAISAIVSLQTAIPAYPWAQVFQQPWAPDGSTDDEQYLDIVRADGIITAQMTNDFTWSGVPSIAAYPREGIPVAWDGGYFWNGTAGVINIEYTVYDVDGNPVLPTIQLSDNAGATITTFDLYPTLAVAPTNGNTLISWHRYESDGMGNWQYNIYYALRDKDGAQILPPTALTFNTNSNERDYFPSVAAFGDGNFAITWTHRNALGVDDVYYAILDNTGNIITSPINLTNNASFDDYGPRANRLSDGNVLLMWYSWDWVVYYTVLDSAGNVVYPISPISTQYAAGFGDAIGLRNGNTIIAWQQWGYYPNWSPQIAYAVLNDAYTTTVPITMSMQILTNTLESDNWNISLARDGNDNAVFTWSDGGSTIYYGVVDNQGNILTPPMPFPIQRPELGADINWRSSANASLPSPRLEVIKSTKAVSVEVGGSLTYTIIISNTGDADATGVTITDTLPANTTFVSADSGGVLVGNQVQWTGLSVGAGSSLSVQFVVQVSNSLPAGSTITNEDYGVRSAEMPVPVTGAPVSTTAVMGQWKIYLPIVLR